ncbi:rsbT co-antagonist protein RsbR [Sphaerotilus hippei]|uniref:RsbT co-antagonist protein RsbR n=1 Tax=Sphaerotilus hippei TaxID=744406 RepID=A0A318H8H8_9BURK|nr:STAS domain-containing protein [Sphaerotilus hippei]PXW94341.1 rsbT co-antagonist protein RsbR [Sphaerotilus hippei]
MTTLPRTLRALIADHHEAVLEDWRHRLAPEAVIDLDGPELRLEMNELLVAMQNALGAELSETAQADLRGLDVVLRNASQVRAARGLSPEGSVQFVLAAKDALLSLVLAHGPDDAEQRSRATLQIQALSDRCVLTLVSQFVATREGVIRSQAQSLLDMSTPVITLWDSILLLPLVGVLDSVRAVQVAERLLEAIGRTEAEVTLIDVTGVPVMDTSVARHLLRTVAAAEMLGTRVILTGISPTTAQTMVKLGIDLSSVPTRGSLKAGVALALTMTGRRVTAGRAD